MALRTVAAKLKAPVASLKQAWAVCRPQAKGPKLSKGLDMDLSDPHIRRVFDENAKLLNRKRTKETAALIVFMTGTTGSALLAMRY
ncbi:hypothetical protein VPH35_057742 [Triticum aestivum]|uniref:Uncharacterized protein n=5 Tax=Aegilops tauschii TaxID=37682 RepID=A0A453DW28_AEGTS